MEKLLLDALQASPTKGLYISPDIPRKKSDNAYACYGIPPSAKVFAIVDTTVFGSAKNGLAFTSEGLFWKNDWTTTSAKTCMSWEEFESSADARSTKGFDLLLGGGCALGMSGCDMKPKELLQLMTNIAALMKPAADDAAQPMAAVASQQVASTELADQTEQIIAPAPADDSLNVPQAPAPRPAPAFEGSYHQPHLKIVNAVASRHRLAQQVQVAPSIKVFKIKKVLEISAGQIKPYDVLLIVDNTFLQTAKDFLVVTPQCLWAKGTLRKLDKFPLSEIRSIRCEAKNLYINDYDFQYLDQLTENEVLVLTNMLKDLVGVLRGNTDESEPGGECLPTFLDELLSRSFEKVIGNTLSRLEATSNPEAREAVSLLTGCLCKVFYEVNVQLQNSNADRGALLGQYLLAQNVASVLALRGSEQLWQSVELQAMYVMIQGELTSQLLTQAERAGIDVVHNKIWYLRILRCVMEADTLEQGVSNLEQAFGRLTAAQEEAVESALKRIEAVQELFVGALQ